MQVLGWSKWLLWCSGRFLQDYSAVAREFRVAVMGLLCCC